MVKKNQMHAYEMSYKCQLTQLPHKFSYIVAIFIHNYLESPNTYHLNAVQKSKNHGGANNTLFMTFPITYQSDR
jgi:hypothetical protein